MRGKVLLWIVVYKRGRITPAYAGKSCYMGAHTRKAVGSPPPMRGKVAVCGDLCYYERITPAYAGKSVRTVQGFQPCRDHPRLCGEKLFHGTFQTAGAGSPPPMRGKARWTRTSRSSRGITPAYAGKSQQPLPPAGTAEDHPRLCGEKVNCRVP